MLPHIALMHCQSLRIRTHHQGCVPLRNYIARCFTTFTLRSPPKCSVWHMCRWPLKRFHTAHRSHLDVISLLHLSPGPDCPLTRMRDLELMSTRAFRQAHGQTPLLRADMTPTLRSLPYWSRPLLRQRPLSPPGVSPPVAADPRRGGCRGIARRVPAAGPW